MSKNFELLENLGHDEELFGASEELVVSSVMPGTPVQPDEEIDKRARDKALTAASLPSVFEAPARPASTSESSFGPDTPPPSRSSISSADTASFARERDETVAGSEYVEPDSRTNPSSPEVAPSDFPHEPNVDERERNAHSRRPPMRSNGPAVRQWLGTLREGVRSWNYRNKAADDGAKVSRPDLETLSRDEELKLVQRIFPESGADLRRLTLFSSVEGKRSCASICGRTAELLAARGDGPVCAVDANFESPCLHQYFGTENDRGLADAALESGAIHGFVKQIPEPDLWLLPAGTASAALNFPAIADGLRSRIMELRSAFRYVVIYAGPLRLQTIPMLISRWTDGVVLVLEANSTPRDYAKRVTEMLRAANVSLLGVVLNNRTFPIPEPIYRRL